MSIVFFVGIGFAAFLWWLASRFFGLISKGSLSPEALAALKDLPLALPEGTVRALLALIVAVVGLPLLLFSNVLHLTDGVAGYVNGIITGVFASISERAPPLSRHRRSARSLMPIVAPTRRKPSVTLPKPTRSRPTRWPMPPAVRAASTRRSTS